MSRKAFLVFLLVEIFLVIVSFMSGKFFEKQQETKKTIDLDRSLVLLLVRPSDFEITNSQWSSMNYDQAYYEPNNKGVTLEYEIARRDFSTGFPEIHASFNVSHEIKRYRPEELPKTTWIDSIYKETNPEIEVRSLNLKELDKNSRAICEFSKATTSKTCYVESKYNEIISIFTFYGYNMEEAQIVNFITPAMQKFYERLSKSSIK